MKIRISGHYHDAESIPVGADLQSDLKRRGFDGTCWIVKRGQSTALAYRRPNGKFEIVNVNAMQTNR